MQRHLFAPVCCWLLMLFFLVSQFFSLSLFLCFCLAVSLSLCSLCVIPSNYIYIYFRSLTQIIMKFFYCIDISFIGNHLRIFTLNNLKLLLTISVRFAQLANRVKYVALFVEFVIQTIPMHHSIVWCDLSLLFVKILYFE